MFKISIRKALSYSRNTAIRSRNKIARGWESFKTSKKERETKQKQAETSLQSSEQMFGTGTLSQVSPIL